MEICDINPLIFYARIQDYGKDSHSEAFEEQVCSYNGRLFYIDEGECRVLVDDREYKVGKDTLMIWQAGIKYCFLSHENVKMFALNFDYTQKSRGVTESIAPVPLRKFKADKMSAPECFESCECFNRPLIMENMQTLRKNILKIIDKFNSIRRYKNEAASATLKGVLTEIAALNSYSDNKFYAKVDMALEYIKENYDREITNEELGRLTGYHPYYLNRLVLKHTGETLRQQLINTRIENAKEMLTQTSLSIYEVGERCGFNNSTYFSGCFRAKTGMTPSVYRKKFKNLI